MKSGIEIQAVSENGRTLLRKALFNSPFQVRDITPKPNRNLHLMITSSSPGLLDGDEVFTRIQLEEHAEVLLDTQAYQRVFPSINDVVQTQEVLLKTGSMLAYLPHPIVPHFDSGLVSLTRIHLEPGARLIWGEITASGRHMKDRAYRKLRLETEIYQKLLCTGAPGVRPDQQDLCTGEPGVRPDQQDLCTGAPGVRPDQQDLCTGAPGVRPCWDGSLLGSLPQGRHEVCPYRVPGVRPCWDGSLLRSLTQGRHEVCPYRVSGVHPVGTAGELSQLILRELLHLEPARMPVHKMGMLGEFTHQGSLIMLVGQEDIELPQIEGLRIARTSIPGGVLIRALATSGEKIFDAFRIIGLRAFQHHESLTHARV